VDEVSVEIGKSEERLDVFDFSRFGPIFDGLDLHGKAIWRQNVSEIFHGVVVALASEGIQAMLPELLENFLDVGLML
jgi:hypothetical protein